MELAYVAQSLYITLGVELGLVFEAGSGELCNSSSRALASFNSALSKPSVNKWKILAELLRTPHGLTNVIAAQTVARSVVRRSLGLR
jgi:hypothetical protein